MNLKLIFKNTPSCAVDSNFYHFYIYNFLTQNNFVPRSYIVIIKFTIYARFSIKNWCSHYFIRNSGQINFTGVLYASINTQLRAAQTRSSWRHPSVIRSPVGYSYYFISGDKFLYVHGVKEQKIKSVFHPAYPYLHSI